MSIARNMSEAETYWDRSSWIALTISLAVFVLLALSIIATWIVPSDGWAYNSPNETTWRSEWTLTANLAHNPSDLQAGDILIAIDGKSLPELYAQALPFWRLQAPQWSDGHILHYTVQRGADKVTVDVPVRRLSPVEQLWYGLSTARGGIVDPLAALTQVLLAWSILGIALLVFWKRPRDLAAHALLLMGVGFFFSPYYYVDGPTLLFYPASSPAIARMLNGWESGIGSGLIYLLLTLPRPLAIIRRVPSLALLLAVVSQHLDNIVLTLLYADNASAFNEISSVTSLAIWVVLLLLMVAKSGISAFRSRAPVERAQMQWVTFGFVMLGVGGITYSVAGFSDSGFNLLIVIIQNVSQLVFPVALAIAITRYRLFDIDVLIRRTLIYAVLTVVLAIIYLASVVLLQESLRTVTGQTSDLAIVVSTLAIAALFAPLRRRIQSVVDRKLYRRKYNVEQVLANFGGMVRNEVDLTHLTGELLDVVNETMQPASAGLWLRKMPREVKG